MTKRVSEDEDGSSKNVEFNILTCESLCTVATISRLILEDRKLSHQVIGLGAQCYSVKLSQFNLEVIGSGP